jgi:hypothetical protein
VLAPKNLWPAAYATGVRNYASVMKIAPWVKIGAVLTAPTNWPDNQRGQAKPLPPANTASNWGDTWNDIVLSQACNSIDFVDVHWYPHAHSVNDGRLQLLSGIPKYPNMNTGNPIGLIGC